MVVLPKADVPKPDGFPNADVLAGVPKADEEGAPNAEVDEGLSERKPVTVGGEALNEFTACWYNWFTLARALVKVDSAAEMRLASYDIYSKARL